MFSLFELMDEKKKYQKATMQIVKGRLDAALGGLGIPMEPSPLYAAYYGIIDIEALLREYVGDEVVQFMKENFHPLDPVYRLAADHSIVLLNGSGFAAPDWSLRISLANLPDEAYDDIGRGVRAVARSYAEAYQFATGKQVTVKGGARVTPERTKS
jgi:aspartate 4-decarboxylase